VPVKLKFENVNLTYSSSDGAVQALSGFELQLKAGEPVALIGPSGSGKTSSLLLAAGLLQASQGQVTVDDQLLSKPRSQTALILQDYGLLPWKTVYENVALGLQIRKVSHLERQAKTQVALAQVGLESFARMYPDELSGGMRQRVALARVLTLDADLLLMDEPLSSLDALLRESMQDMLLELWLERCYAQLLVTHSIEEAAFLGARILVMDQRPGRVRAVIANPEMGSLEYRRDPSFFAVCQQIREALFLGTGSGEDSGASSGTGSGEGSGTGSDIDTCALATESKHA